MTEVKIIYSGFYDAPLAFVAGYKGTQYLFWRVFDDELDDYPQEYEVFVLPDLSEAEVKESWAYLPKKAKTYLGKIVMSKIVFDPTKRLSIKSSVFDYLPK